MHLERNVSGLLSALEDNGIVVPPSNSPETNRISDKPNGKADSVRWRELNGRHSEGEEIEAVRRALARLTTR